VSGVEEKISIALGRLRRGRRRERKDHIETRSEQIVRKGSRSYRGVTHKGKKRKETGKPIESGAGQEY